MNILSATLVLVFAGLFNNPSFEVKATNYIEEHKELAIVEMYRSGIPASITMAQALHESNFGSSELAKNANNHFGIKCKSYWEGETYFHEDDDYDSAGKLMESCFRAYDSVYDSYIDHSNFLVKTRYYRDLFNYDKTDYVSWAVGLQKAGYATDPNYAKKLIGLVKKYDLDILDTMEDPLRKLRELD